MPLDCQDDIGQHAMTFGHALFFEILAHEYLEPIIKITTNMYFNTLLKGLNGLPEEQEVLTLGVVDFLESTVQEDFF